MFSPENDILYVLLAYVNVGFAVADIYRAASIMFSSEIPAGQIAMLICCISDTTI